MTENTDRDTALRRAYGKATTALRAAHRQEFDSLYQQAAAAEGVEWTPRKSPEQKAQEQIDELLAAYPHLREHLAGDATSPSPGPANAG